MALGELYKPRGLALEQARAVLEVDEPYAVNVAWGCSNACLYCYGPGVGRQTRQNWSIVRLPKKDPKELVEKQLKGVAPDGVFVSFMTDPFLPENRAATERLIGLLLERGIRVATSSKVDVSAHAGVRHGMTVVSLNEDFAKKWEPNAPLPKTRIKKLRRAHNRGDFTWVSMEPCPPRSFITTSLGDYLSNLRELLKEIAFANMIIKGRWHYDPRAATEEARNDYREIFHEVARFCERRRIKFHPKSETVDFIRGQERRRSKRGGGIV